jgi:carbon storage regulator
MLILTLRPGETVHIGDTIVVTLAGVERNRARVGVHAPREISIDREEVRAAKKDGGEPNAHKRPRRSPRRDRRPPRDVVARDPNGDADGNR